MEAIQTAPAPRLGRTRTAAALALVLLALMIAGVVAARVGADITPGPALTELDRQVNEAVAAGRTPQGTSAMLAASWLADLPVAAGIVALLGGTVGLLRRGWRLLWVPFLSGAGALAISVAVKLAAGRERPPLTLSVVEASGPAFPSGHTIRALAVYGAITWLVAALLRGRTARALVILAGSAVVLAVGASRVYLGAHWVTDVLAGYGIGAVWLVALMALTAPRLPSARPTRLRTRDRV